MNPEKTLIITLLDSGQVEVTGPLEDKIFCYGLLKAGEKEIDKWEPQKLILIPKNNGGRLLDG